MRPSRTIHGAPTSWLSQDILAAGRVVTAHSPAQYTKQWPREYHHNYTLLVIVFASICNIHAHVTRIIEFGLKLAVCINYELNSYRHAAELQYS